MWRQSAMLLMIGDTTHDLQMAERAGCPSVGCQRQYVGQLSLNPLFVAHSVAELGGGCW
jgi:phosphoglycolate phosphatase